MKAPITHLGHQDPPKKTKPAYANYENMLKVFTAPETKDSTLSKIEAEISENLLGYLRQTIVAGDLTPQDLEKDFSDPVINENPIFVSEQAEFLLKKVVAQSVHTSSPAFIGHMTSALPYFMLPLAKIMFALNQNLVKIETSKAFTPLERQVIGMLHRLIYKFPSSFYARHIQSQDTSLGAFGSGGTVANITSLWVARNYLLRRRGTFAGIRKLGLFEAMRQRGFNDLALVMSERAHYSLRKASDLLGIGSRYVIKIPVNSSQKIDLDELKRNITQLKENKIGIIAVVGVAGATETGTVDDLEAMSEITQKERLHFHVDAAWGGPTLFSEQHSHLLKGIEKADSVTFDAHKQLYVPVGAGISLYRNPHHLDHIENHAAYIIRQGSRDLGKNTLEGTRQGMALLVHSALRIIGSKGFEILIDLGIAHAKLFAQMIESDGNFELLLKPELNLINYRYVPKELKEFLSIKNAKSVKINEFLNKLTIAIQKEQRAQGKTFVSRTSLMFSQYEKQKITVFRAVISNPLTEERILHQVLEEQKEIAKNLLMTKEHNLEKFVNKLS